jgi:hypothetical protein
LSKIQKLINEMEVHNVNIFDFPSNDYLYLLSMAGDDIKVNDNSEIKKGIISNVGSNINLRFDNVKSIITDATIKRGDIINYNTEKWLALSDNLKNRYTKVIIQRCNYNIKFNFQGTIKEFPAIVNSKVFDTETNRYVSTPAGEIVVTMQDNNDSGNIKINDRFIKMKNAWKVTGIDRTKNGLLVLYCDLDGITVNDDLENEIANAGNYVYTLEITNGETASIQEASTLQLNTQVKLNGNIVDNKTVVYSCDNPSIATVDENGLITAISAGECIITVSLAENPNIYDTISITVTALPEHDYTVTISGSTSIVKTKTATYTATFTDNAVPITEESEFWLTADDGVSETTLATIESQDTIANTCVVTAGDTIGYVKLWCKNKAGTIISDPFRIKIKNLF